MKRALIIAALVAAGCANSPAQSAASPAPPTIDPKEEAAFIAQRMLEETGTAPTDVECGDRPIPRRPGERFICSGKYRGQPIWWVAEQQVDSVIFYPYGQGA